MDKMFVVMLWCIDQMNSDQAFQGNSTTDAFDVSITQTS